MRPHGLRIEVAASVHRWTLERPERRNALTSDLMHALLGAARTAGEDDRCRVVVLEATPPAFCSGADLRELARLPVEIAIETQRGWARMGRALAELERVVVAVIRGPVIGGGVFLATFADYRIASTDARLGVPEVSLGWMPPGGLEDLIRLVGAGPARRLLLDGRPIEATEALRLGLIDQLERPGDLHLALEHLVDRFGALSNEVVTDLKRYFRDRNRLSIAEREALQFTLFADGFGRPAAQAVLDPYRS